MVAETGRLSIRVRTTLAATAIVALAIAASGVGLLRLLERQVVKGVDSGLRARLDELQASGRDLILPPTLPDTGDEGSIVQVIGTDGSVISQSANITDRTPIVTLAPNGAPLIRTVEQARIADIATYRVATRRIQGPSGALDVVVGASLDPGRESVATMRRVLLFGMPVMLGAVALATWFSVGRVLAPVESIRSTVADISATDLDRRVPEPVGGDEIARLARTMNEMLARLDAGGRRQRAFVADASHELRTPLASLQTQLDVALNRSEQTDWPSAVEQLRDDVHRVRQLAENLLFLAVADDSDIASTVELVDLDELVLRVVEPIRLQGRVQLDLTKVGAARVRGDASQLGRMLVNLLDNAERYAANRVTVSLQQNAATTTIVIGDDGPGIPPHERERVFERFARVDSARRRRDGGAGLGLAIAKAIILAHGGTIAIGEKTPGTDFVVTLPART